jgi:hypothetical protein
MHQFYIIVESRTAVKKNAMVAFIVEVTKA